MAFDEFSRRKFLEGTAAAALAGTLPAQMALAKDLVVGFIYVGPRDDYGYNQAHAEGAAIVKSMPGVKVLEEEKVAEAVDVQKTMQSMVELDGASLLFPTSFGYFDPHMLRVAEKYPKIEFRHCGGLWTKGKHPANTGSYFGYIGLGQYLDRKSTRLNSSHTVISYAVFCLKKKNKNKARCVSKTFQYSEQIVMTICSR